MDDIQRAIHCLEVITDKAVCEECESYSTCDHEVQEEMARIAISAIQELQQYQAIGTVVRFKNQKSELDAAYEMLGEYQTIGTLEEYRAAWERQQAVPARKTTIFEGEDAEKRIRMGLPNYETYKCPKCGRIVAERAFNRSLYPDGFAKKNYCENCGQEIDWSVEE